MLSLAPRLPRRRRPGDAPRPGWERRRPAGERDAPRREGEKRVDPGCSSRSALAARPVRPQADPGGSGHGEELPDSIRKGPSAHRHDGDAGRFPPRRQQVQVFTPRRQRAATAQATFFRTPRKWPTGCALIRIDAHRGDQPRPGDHVLPDRRADRPAGRTSGRGSPYGLGSLSSDLPAYVALVSKGSGNPADQPLYDRLWGSGFLPSRYQGVKFRSGGDPVLYLGNPPGVDVGTPPGGCSTTSPRLTR